MTLTKRISLQLAAAISLMVFAYLLVLIQFISVQSLLSETVQQIRLVDALSLKLFQLQHNLEIALLSSDENHPPDSTRLIDLEASIREAAENYLSRTDDPARRQSLERFLEVRKSMEAMEKRLSDPPEATDAETYRIILAEWKQNADVAHATLTEMAGVRLRIQAAFLEKIDEKRSTTLKIAIFFVVVGAICLVVIWTYTRKNLLIPLRRLASSAEALSKGEEVIRIPDTERKDEVGILARSFESMVAAVQNRTEKLMLKNLQLENEIKDRKRVERELSIAKEDLERRVEERTVEIQRRSKDLETLLYVTSHDLREPLRAIRHFSTLLLEKEQTSRDEASNDFLERIHNGAARLDQLIEDILLLSQAQRMEEEMVEVSGEELVREALGGLAQKIEETGASIYIEEGFPTFCVSPRWVAQALYNLIGNSLKFHRPGENPEIEIAPIPDDRKDLGEGYVIRDRGPGIQPEYGEQIFGLFKRAVGREVEGTGAGLAIVKQVAERHGGRVWYEPREEGGAQFFLTLKTPPPSKIGRDCGEQVEVD
ncbi:MAG: HAMP domain-containing protein [Candidatus Omnitrophica bacterium]|nr:HAMP domain-containing protein [Candidatus Omnitrophota bacterium]